MQIKIIIKNLLIKSKLWFELDLLRRVPRIIRWLKSGSAGVAPHPVKMMAVRSYLKRYSIGTFIETGTYLGDTLDYVSRSGANCISIELSEVLYERACKRFDKRKNIRLVQGDSGQKLPELIKDINSPVLFWLDGHYSAGLTSSMDTHTPISAELDAILSHHINRHVILIDDAHCFDGTNNYPHLDELISKIREDGNYTAEVSIDIIRLVPRAVL